MKTVKKRTLASRCILDQNRRVPVDQTLRCSRYISVLTWFMLPFPVTYLLFSILIYDLDSKGILSLVLSPLFYVASFFWIITGVGVRKLKKWSWYTLLVAEFFIFYLNAVILVHYSQSAFKGWAFALTVLIQIYTWVAVKKELRVPYLFPKIRWWESGLAGVPHVDVQVNGLGGQILDIDFKGCFIKTHHDFQDFEKVFILFGLEPHSFAVEGEVVWNAKSTVTHPKGIGVMFHSLGKKNKKKLKGIIRNFLKELE